MNLRSLQFKVLLVVVVSLGLPFAVAVWALGRFYDATEARAAAPEANGLIARVAAKSLPMRVSPALAATDGWKQF